MDKIPNLIKLYIDSYFCCGVSWVLLWWQYTGDKSDRTSPRRQTAIALVVSAIAVWGSRVRGSGARVLPLG